MKRRTFNHLMMHALAAAAIPSTAWGELRRALRLFPQIGDRRLVVIQLSGGNDGLNTIVPFRNDVYQKHRDNLSLKREDLLLLGDDVGMNTAFKPLMKHWERGDLLCINQVGHPYATRSHFDSIDIWHSAKANGADERTGWIGRMMDTAGVEDPGRALQLDGQLSLALRGSLFKGMAVNRLGDLRSLAKLNIYPDEGASLYDNDALEHHIMKHMEAVVSEAKALQKQYRPFRENSDYPANPFSLKLKQIGDGILSELPTSVYFAELGGFDTHVNQAKRQEKLLDLLATSLDRFIEVLRSAGKWDNTMILVYSEFGRRVAQNGSAGTDHGKGSNAFILSGGLQRHGMYNRLTDLVNLDEGDIPVEIDFRRMYHSAQAEWFGIPLAQNEAHPPLGIFG